METPLEILSRAAQMVDNANAELLRVVGQRKVRSAVPRKHHKRNSAPTPTALPLLDEPLDMSLKTRKRATSGDSGASSNNSDGDFSIKKHRPSVISYGRMPERHVQENIPVESQYNRGYGGNPNPMQPGVPLQMYQSIVMPRRRIQPRLVISEDYSVAGIDAHFAKSLLKYMKKDEAGEHLDKKKKDEDGKNFILDAAEEVLEIKFDPNNLKRKHEADVEPKCKNKKIDVSVLKEFEEPLNFDIKPNISDIPVDLKMDVNIFKKNAQTEANEPQKQ